MSHQGGLGKAARCRVHEITGTQVQRLLAKLQVIDKFLPNIKLSEILSTTDYNTGEANCNQDEKGGKHVLQEVSIIGHLRRINALHDDTTTAIELGAGTGRLSDRLQRVTNAKLTHILIDRQDFEHHCRDRVLRARCRSPERQIKRVVADIGSLKIHDYSSINTSFCMSKHLCGPACDLAITSLSRMAEQTTPQFLPPAAIATCCHYLCTWESFTGKDFWLAMGLTTEDFIVATTCSQWASLQRKKSLNNETNASTETKMLPNLLQVAHSAKASLDEMDMSTCEIQFLPSKEFERCIHVKKRLSLG